MTDEWDRRTLNTILERFYREEVVLHEKYMFDPSELYYVPPVSEYSLFLDYVKELPMSTAPSVFGMHENADIIKDQQESYLMLSSILVTQVLTRLSRSSLRNFSPLFLLLSFCSLFFFSFGNTI